MTDATRDDDRDEPIEEVASEIDDAPAAGVIDDDRTDPPEPSEPG